MGDAFDNLQAFNEGHYGEGQSECSGDGQIDYYSPMASYYEHTEECPKEPRDCLRCPSYVKEKWGDRLERMTKKEVANGLEG